MPSQSFRWGAIYLWLAPCERFSVKHMKILKMFISRMPSEQIEFRPQDCHCVCISCHGLHSWHLWLDPSHGVQIEDVDVVEALVAVVAAKHVELPADSRHRMTCACWWFLNYPSLKNENINTCPETLGFDQTKEDVLRTYKSSSHWLPSWPPWKYILSPYTAVVWLFLQAGMGPKVSGSLLLS